MYTNQLSLARSRCIFMSYSVIRQLLSFPTRRSSDLTRFLKTIFVEIPILGLANTTQQDGGRGSFSIISPRPFTNAVSFITQKGTSDPIRRQICANSSGAMLSAQRRFRPRITAAASLHHTHNPAETGIFFSIFI